jgi:RsmE family RNA methyltransferase
MTLDTIETDEINLLSNAQDVGIWVWPEWGWSLSERDKMKEKGFIFARFWERILRTETAGVAIGFHLLHI